MLNGEDQRAEWASNGETQYIIELLYYVEAMLTIHIL